jgi:hypothetical protein
MEGLKGGMVSKKGNLSQNDKRYRKRGQEIVDYSKKAFAEHKTAN